MNSYMMMTYRNTVFTFALFLLLLSVSNSLADNSWRDKEIKGRHVYFDDEDVPLDQDLGNPYVILVEFIQETPILMHDGQPHPIGHIVQVIRDGGNHKIDPPNADGSPGGDDSLAWGNFNHSRIGAFGLSPTDTMYFGMWVTQRYFISFHEDGVYYLRLWEGVNPETAPYYQDSIEYSASTGDNGGAMARITPRLFYGPQDIFWKFGRSVERPKK
jgi:hypothetical protein